MNAQSTRGADAVDRERPVGHQTPRRGWHPRAVEGIGAAASGEGPARAWQRGNNPRSSWSNRTSRIGKAPGGCSRDAQVREEQKTARAMAVMTEPPPCRAQRLRVGADAAAKATVRPCGRH